MDEAQDAIEEAVDLQAEETAEPPVAVKPKGQEHNWKAAREAERKRAEADAKRIAELESRLSAKESEDDDELVERRHVKPLEELIQRNQQDLLQLRLSSQFPDFASVVSEENLSKLQTAEPEVFKVLMSGSDPYAKSVTAYKTLKKYGIIEDPDLEAAREKAKANYQKPASLNSVKSTSPLSEASSFSSHRLTADQKKALWEETKRLASGG